MLWTTICSQRVVLMVLLATTSSSRHSYSRYSRQTLPLGNNRKQEYFLWMWQCLHTLQLLQVDHTPSIPMMLTTIDPHGRMYSTTVEDQWYRCSTTYISSYLLVARVPYYQQYSYDTKTPTPTANTQPHATHCCLCEQLKSAALFSARQKGRQRELAGSNNIIIITLQTETVYYRVVIISWCC